jgi:rfaE bifunctional protein kinase chain/domain
VVGDFTLDAYWHADMTRSELSREAPLHARPVVRERYSPGGAANTAWNVADLGAGETYALAILGRDWRGALLTDALARAGVRLEHAVIRNDCVTPLYGKVWLEAHGQSQEDARLDFIQPEPYSPAAEDALIAQLDAAAGSLDALVVADYFTQGVITPRVRAALVEIAARCAGLAIVVDSRLRIREYPGMALKPNDIEAVAALDITIDLRGLADLEGLARAGAAWQAAQRRPLFITLGPRGCLVLSEGGGAEHVPTVHVPPPIDTVGAGDTFISALACALAAGATPAEAAALANLAAAVTIRKLRVTGTASPAEILAVWDEAA